MSVLAVFTFRTGVAQLAEHWIPNPAVGGSSPSARVSAASRFLLCLVGARFVCAGFVSRSFCFESLRDVQQRQGSRRLGDR